MDIKQTCLSFLLSQLMCELMNVYVNKTIMSLQQFGLNRSIHMD